MKFQELEKYFEEYIKIRKENWGKSVEWLEELPIKNFLKFVKEKEDNVNCDGY